MTTARSIITASLTFGLNRLSPGETLDADTASVALDALNHIADEMNGGKSFLFRELLTVSASGITGTSGTLGTTWAALSPGDEVLGATYSDGSSDIPILPWTMAQYANEPSKSTAGAPMYYAPDGLSLVYFWPACAGQYVTLRTRATVADFADIDTDYLMPKGYKSALSALLAEKLAPTMIGGVTPAIRASATAARQRLSSQAVNPAILVGSEMVGNILTGWR